MLIISVLVSSKLSLGTLKLDWYTGLVSLFNNKLSKSSKPLKNSSVIPSLGLIKIFSLIDDPVNGFPLTFIFNKLFASGSVYETT